jgi:predicted PurR-regulated permease PerM
MQEPGDESRAGAAGGVTPALRLLLALAAGAILLLALRVAASIVDPIVLALVVTVAVSPLLTGLIRRGVPAWLAWLITVIVTLAAVAFVVVVGLTGIARLIGEVPRYQSELAVRWQHARTALQHVGLDSSGLTQGHSAFLDPQRVTKVAVHVLQVARRAVSTGLLTLLLVLFMLGEAASVGLRFAATPPRVSKTLARLEVFTGDMRQFVQATTIAGLVAGAAVTAFLALIGVRYPLLWGLFAFFMAFIPTLGPLLAIAPPTFLALLESGWSKALLTAVGMFVVFLIVGNLVGRRLVARRTNLSTLTVVLSVVLWGWVLGLLGGLLAVPMTLLVRRLFIEVYDESGWATALLGRVARRP